MTELFTKKELIEKTGDGGSKIYSTRIFSKILDAANKFHKLGSASKLTDILHVLDTLKKLTDDWQKKPDSDSKTTIEKKRQVITELQQQVDKLISEHQSAVMTKKELIAKTGDSGAIVLATRTFSKILDALNNYERRHRNSSGKEIYAALTCIEKLTALWLDQHRADKREEAAKKRPHIEKIQQQVVNELEKYQTYSSSAGAFLTDKVIDSLKPVKESHYTPKEPTPEGLRDELFNFINDGGLGAKGQYSYTFQTLGKKASVSGSGDVFPWLKLAATTSGSASDHKFLYIERQSVDDEQNKRPVALVGMEGYQYEAEIGATITAGIDKSIGRGVGKSIDKGSTVELMSIGLHTELKASTEAKAEAKMEAGISISGALGGRCVKASVDQPIYTESPLGIREPALKFLLQQQNTKGYAKTDTNYISLFVGKTATKAAATAGASAGAEASAIAQAKASAEAKVNIGKDLTLSTLEDDPNLSRGIKNGVEVGLSTSFAIESNISGQINVGLYRIQTTASNGVNKTQDTLITFKQIGGTALGIGAELKGALTGALASDERGLKKEVSLKKEKTFELLNAIEYTTGIAYWTSSNGCQCLEGTGLIRGHSVSMPSVIKYFRESNVEGSQFPTQYVQKLSKTLHVSTDQVKRFLDASEGLLDALGYDPGFNPKALIIEASFAPKANDTLSEVTIDATINAQLNDVRTALETKKDLQPQMLKFRYRMENEDNSDTEKFSLGFNIGVVEFGISLENIDRSGKRSLVDLFNYQLASTAAEEAELNRALTSTSNEIGRAVLLF